jgi:hypothetical protein
MTQSSSFSATPRRPLEVSPTPSSSTTRTENKFRPDFSWRGFPLVALFHEPQELSLERNLIAQLSDFWIVEGLRKPTKHGIGEQRNQFLRIVNLIRAIEVSVAFVGHAMDTVNPMIPMEPFRPRGTPIIVFILPPPKPSLIKRDVGMRGE